MRLAPQVLVDRGALPSVFQSGVRSGRKVEVQGKWLAAI